jgi:hypothetical protein
MIQAARIIERGLATTRLIFVGYTLISYYSH